MVWKLPVQVPLRSQLWEAPRPYLALRKGLFPLCLCSLAHSACPHADPSAAHLPLIIPLSEASSPWRSPQVFPPLHPPAQTSLTATRCQINSWLNPPPGLRATFCPDTWHREWFTLLLSILTWWPLYYSTCCLSGPGFVLDLSLLLGTGRNKNSPPFPYDLSSDTSYGGTGETKLCFFSWHPYSPPYTFTWRKLEGVYKRKPTLLPIYRELHPKQCWYAFPSPSSSLYSHVSSLGLETFRANPLWFSFSTPNFTWVLTASLNYPFQTPQSPFLLSLKLRLLSANYPLASSQNVPFTLFW